MCHIIYACLIALLSAASSAQAQGSFVYGGYRVGKYFVEEAVAQNYAAKFNLGWEFETDTDPIPLFFPGDTLFDVTNNMNWGNLPGGVTLGFVVNSGDNFGFEIGYHQFGQKSSGKRVNLSTNSEEKFTLKSWAGTISFSAVYMPNKLIMPFFSVDMGHYRMWYSYESDQYDISKQRLGYNVRLLGSTKPGDKPLCVAFSIGAYINAFSMGKASLKIVPMLQSRVDIMEDIYMGLYRSEKFSHDNWNVSFLLTYDLD